MFAFAHALLLMVPLLTFLTSYLKGLFGCAISIQTSLS